MREICPYCHRVSKVSRDHIFSDFLGGRSWIKACKVCNNMFGHSFEGRSFNNLIPVLVVLGINGVKPRKKLVWKDAYMSHGVYFDLDSNNKSEARLQKLPINGSKFLKLVTTKAYTNLWDHLAKKFNGPKYRITSFE